MQKKLCEWPAMIRWWHSWCSRMHSSSEMQKMIAQLLRRHILVTPPSPIFHKMHKIHKIHKIRRVQKVRAAIICTTTHPPRHILQSCTRQTRKHRIFPTSITKCFPQTISASNNLHRVCLPFQLTSRWEMKEVLFSIGNEKAFLNATQSSSIWSRPDLEMQFQTRSIVPNYFERSLPALTRCQYLLLFLLTL